MVGPRGLVASEARGGGFRLAGGPVTNTGAWDADRLALGVMARFDFSVIV
jgi:hypothetical protein